MFAGLPTPAAHTAHAHFSRFQTGATNFELLPGKNEVSGTGADKHKTAAKLARIFKMQVCVATCVVLLLGVGAYGIVGLPYEERTEVLQLVQMIFGLFLGVVLVCVFNCWFVIKVRSVLKRDPEIDDGEKTDHAAVS